MPSTRNKSRLNLAADAQRLFLEDAAQSLNCFALFFQMTKHFNLKFTKPTINA